MQVGQGVIYVQVQVPDMFGSELAAALDYDSSANNLINLVQNNLIKVSLVRGNEMIFARLEDLGRARRKAVMS